MLQVVLATPAPVMSIFQFTFWIHLQMILIFSVIQQAHSQQATQSKSNEVGVGHTLKILQMVIFQLTRFFTREARFVMQNLKIEPEVPIVFTNIFIEFII